MKSLSFVRLFATPWTVAYQASLLMGFSRQEYWSGLPFPSPGILLTQVSHTGGSSGSSKVKIPWYLLGCLTVYVKERHIPKGTGCEKALRQETDYVPSETLKDTWSEPVSKKEANGRWCWRGRRSETCRDLEQWEIRKQFQAGSNTIHVSLCLCFNVLAMPWGS